MSAGFIFLIPVMVIAKPNVILEAQLYSKYPWRCVLFEGGADLNGEVSIGNFGFGVYLYSMWEEKRLNEIQIDEIDPMLFYQIQTAYGSIRLALTKYNVRSDPGKKWDNSWDAGIILEFSNMPLSPILEYCYDFGMFDANYFGINLSQSILPSLTVLMTAGINDGQWTVETVKSVYIGISKEFEFYFLKIEFTAGNFYEGENYPLVIFNISI